MSRAGRIDRDGIPPNAARLPPNAPAQPDAAQQFLRAQRAYAIAPPGEPFEFRGHPELLSDRFARQNPHRAPFGPAPVNPNFGAGPRRLPQDQPPGQPLGPLQGQSQRQAPAQSLYAEAERRDARAPTPQYAPNFAGAPSARAATSYADPMQRPRRRVGSQVGAQFGGRAAHPDGGAGNLRASRGSYPVAFPYAEPGVSNFAAGYPAPQPLEAPPYGGERFPFGARFSNNAAQNAVQPPRPGYGRFAAHAEHRHAPYSLQPRPNAAHGGAPVLMHGAQRALDASGVAPKAPIAMASGANRGANYAPLHGAPYLQRPRVAGAPHSDAPYPYHPGGMPPRALAPGVPPPLEHKSFVSPPRYAPAARGMPHAVGLPAFQLSGAAPAHATLGQYDGLQFGGRLPVGMRCGPRAPPVSKMLPVPQLPANFIQPLSRGFCVLLSEKPNKRRGEKLGAAAESAGSKLSKESFSVLQFSKPLGALSALSAYDHESGLITCASHNANTIFSDINWVHSRIRVGGSPENLSSEQVANYSAILSSVPPNCRVQLHELHAALQHFFPHWSIVAELLVSHTLVFRRAERINAANLKAAPFRLPNELVLQLKLGERAVYDIDMREATEDNLFATQLHQKALPLDTPLARLKQLASQLEFYGRFATYVVTPECVLVQTPGDEDELCSAFAFIMPLLSAFVASSK